MGTVRCTGSLSVSPPILCTHFPVHMRYLPDAFTLWCHDEAVYAYYFFNLTKKVSEYQFVFAAKIRVCTSWPSLNQMSFFFVLTSRIFTIRTQIGVHSRLQAPPPPPGCWLSERTIIKPGVLLSSSLNQNMIWHSLPQRGFLSLNEPGLWSDLCRFWSQVV